MHPLHPIRVSRPRSVLAALADRPTLRLGAALALLVATAGLATSTPHDAGAAALGRGNYAFGATMFGTAEGDGLVGDTTSSGYRMRPYDRVVALPACTQSSCPWLDPGADKDGPYGAQTMCAEADGLCWVQIVSDVTGECAVAPVRDVGPLFARDNWWGLQRERTYPLKRGLTAAAVTAGGGDVGFGPGISDVGHDIAEDYSYAAAVDLGPGTWIDLGLDPDHGFSTVQVKLLWQAGMHHLDACGGNYGNAETVDQVFLRQGPGTGYAILASLPAGRRLSITGAMQNGFYLVDTDGMRGWVSRKYVRPDGGATGAKVGFATDWVNVRWGPSTGYGVAATMPEGAVALVTGARVDGFFPVRFNGVEGWVSSTYLDVGVTSGLSRDIGIVDETVNMRSGPGFDRAVITVIPTGMPAYLAGGERNGFRPVSYGSERGWIHSDYLIIAPRPNTKRATEAVRLRTGPSTDAEIISVIPAGATVTVTGDARNGFLPVNYGGRSGWAHGSYLL